MTLDIFTYGGARGNPGFAACSFIASNGQQQRKYLGIATNNEAEYQGVLLALDYLKCLDDLENLSQINFFSDSQLIVNQINHCWKIKEPRLNSLVQQVWKIMENLKSRVPGLEINFKDIRRELNSKADGLVNQVLDSHLPVG